MTFGCVGFWLMYTKRPTAVNSFFTPNHNNMHSSLSYLNKSRPSSRCMPPSRVRRYAVASSGIGPQVALRVAVAACRRSEHAKGPLCRAEDRAPLTQRRCPMSRPARLTSWPLRLGCTTKRRNADIQCAGWSHACSAVRYPDEALAFSCLLLTSDHPRRSQHVVI